MIKESFLRNYNLAKIYSQAEDEKRRLKVYYFRHMRQILQKQENIPKTKINRIRICENQQKLVHRKKQQTGNKSNILKSKTFLRIKELRLWQNNYEASSDRNYHTFGEQKWRPSNFFDANKKARQIVKEVANDKSQSIAKKMTETSGSLHSHLSPMQSKANQQNLKQVEKEEEGIKNLIIPKQFLGDLEQFEPKIQKCLALKKNRSSFFRNMLRFRGKQNSHLQ